MRTHTGEKHNESKEHEWLLKFNSVITTPQYIHTSNKLQSLGIQKKWLFCVYYNLVNTIEFILVINPMNVRNAKRFLKPIEFVIQIRELILVINFMSIGNVGL